MPAIVLVTGASGDLGSKLAGRLAEDPGNRRVIAVDTAQPDSAGRAALGAAEFVRADIRNPRIEQLLIGAEVDTVVHASMTAHPPGPTGRPLHKEMNVIGTMQLLAACQRAPKVRKLVLKSTAAVYGSGPHHEAVHTEEHEARVVRPRSGYAQDNAEVEAYVRGFARRRPEVTITTLRFASLIGPSVDTVLTRYFSLPFVPMVFGHNARLQLLHARDALAVLHRAVREDLPGKFNVAGDGVLTLTQAIQRAGRVPVPMPGSVIAPVSRFVRGARLVDFGQEQLRYLHFGRVVDTAKLRTEFGYEPRWSTREAFDDFVRGKCLHRVVDTERLAGGPRAGRAALEPAR